MCYFIFQNLLNSAMSGTQGKSPAKVRNESRARKEKYKELLDMGAAIGKVRIHKLTTSLKYYRYFYQKRAIPIISLIPCTRLHP